MKIELLKNLKQERNNAKEILKFSFNPFGMFLICGSVGAGKTYAAKAIYEANTSYSLPYRDDDEAVFTSEYSFFCDWKESLSNPMVNMERYKNTKILIIDDFGSKDPTQGYFEYLFSLMDYRWERGFSLGTVIVINRESKEMKEIFGERFFSRISSGKMITLLNQDRREAIGACLEAQGKAFEGKDVFLCEKEKKSLGWSKEQEIALPIHSWKSMSL